MVPKQQYFLQLWLLWVRQVLWKSLSHVWLFATPLTVPHQDPLSKGFSRQEYWSGLPCTSPGDQQMMYKRLWIRQMYDWPAIYASYWQILLYIVFLLIELLNAILWPRGHTMQIMVLWEKKAACRGASDIANCTICYQNRVFIVT